ncbi:hypothetical protein EW146_g1385 [Bondarzewia mesenterica]|uniref:Hyaluronan/mRNA-binding protein domain-containing protein n=1 Tax=Bondarzewia mesenterica TaxID=1095465 RepID=A0A4S4M432_9AGAM|nr:hypothetical protein EW146_g1385 [Bondarzewia mesenterica]
MNIQSTCTTRHCDTSHTVTAKGKPPGRCPGITHERTAPKSHRSQPGGLLVLQPIMTVSRSSTHSSPPRGGRIIVEMLLKAEHVKATSATSTTAATKPSDNPPVFFALRRERTGPAPSKMSVATKNPFAILDEAEDTSRPSSPAPAAKTAAPAPAPSRGAPKSRGPASRGGRYYQRGGKAPRDTQNQEAVVEDVPAEGKKRFEGEGRGRGRGRGRGERGRGRGAARLDRHSATGKTDSEKKVHQSWGGDEGNSELKAEQAGSNDAINDAVNDWAGVTADNDAWGVPAEGEAAPAPAAPAAEGDKPEESRRRDRDEEEDNTLTYEQYLAQQKEAAAAAVPKLEGIRQANEGADDALWKDVVPKEKKNEEEDAYFAKSAPKARAKKDEKVFLEIDARFERPSRGGRGRGGDRGRGGERGGRGRGARGARASRTNGSSPTIDVGDETAFPSLS